MDWEEERLLYRIAKLYYEENYTQAKIAKELGIYRTTIGRKLKKAREYGIVKIEVKSDRSEQYRLEEKIAKHFCMKEIIIVPSNEEKNKQEAFGKACEELLNRIASDHDTIGLAWGTTLGETVNNLSGLNQKNVHCVPLVGGPGEMPVDFHVNVIVYKMAQMLGGESHFIDAAAVYQSEETTQEILHSGFMNKILELWEDISIAIVGIGSPLKSTNMIWSGFLGETDQHKLAKHKAIGDICSRFYTIEGSIIDSSLSDRTVAVELEKLRELPYSIGIAYSEEKIESIIGAMNGRFINTLITDENTALKINELIENCKG